MNKKLYCLTMFPYPSGDLHIGHWYNFAPADVYARKQRMEGYNVFFPIGFDAFGLPAENAAIKRGVHPETWTYENIEKMREQLKSMNAIYDWSSEVVTCDPQYYKWTQWMFLELFKAGLAYRKRIPANFCPSCQTVLANEQVVEGKCERCDSDVEQKEIEQWLFHIKKYAHELSADLDTVDWPEKTKAMQRNWIGESEGAEIEFLVNGRPLRVYTTRPDTIFGATYLVLAPEHPLLEELKTEIENLSEAEEYIVKAKKKIEMERISDTKEKTGVKLQGVTAINPLSKEEIPVFIADYILLHYGTGAVMAVPAHDSRDYLFAQKHGMPVKRVVSSLEDLPFEGEGETVHSGEFSGTSSAEAKKKIIKYLEKEKKGEKKVNYRVRDWLVSRQRYWGAPIPVIYCKNCYKGGEEGRDYTFYDGEEHAIIPDNNLPVMLPRIDDFRPKEGKSPLARSSSFGEVLCPQCGEKAKRETDTLDTFVCSSWYYLRYADPHNKKEFAEKKKLKELLPVDIYIGGAEHSVLHLLYSRFFTKALRDMGHINFSEPFLKLRHQGTILGPDGRKMSKSKGNVIDPDKEVEEHGADAVRMYLCFMGPYDQGGVWDASNIVGVKRFMDRIRKIETGKENEKTEKLLQKTIKKVTEDIDKLHFNTAISAMMTFINEIEEIGEKQMKTFLTILAPFAPQFTEELFKEVHEQPWPTYDEKMIKEDTVTMIIQVNGKVRTKKEVRADISERKSEKIALEEAKKWTEGKEVKKVVVVGSNLVNIVCAE